MSNTNEAENSSDDDCFEDAIDGSLSDFGVDQPAGECSLEKRAAGEEFSPADLSSTIEACRTALTLFLNNRFTESMDLLVSRAATSPYHALGRAVTMHIQALMTYDTTYIMSAIEAIKEAQQVCQKWRPKKDLTINNLERGVVTELSAHCELINCECTLVRALLTFVQDENWISFVKAGLKIRTGFKQYKELAKLVNDSRFKELPEKIFAHKLDFETGVHMGVGVFNLTLSMLPSRVLALLEFVGFQGNKKLGISELLLTASNTKGLRSPFGKLFVLMYFGVIKYVLGEGDAGDYSLCVRFLGELQADFSAGTIVQYFAGRLKLIGGRFEEAMIDFDAASDAGSLGNDWKQMRLVAIWELMWCHAFKCDWLLATKYAEVFTREGKWSRAVSTYLQVSFLLMLIADKHGSPKTQETADVLMSRIPGYKQRIAGKSIPMEKFVVKKAARYESQSQRLVLPAFEITYLLYGFHLARGRTDLLNQMLETVNTTVKDMDANPSNYQPFFVDDQSLVWLIRGSLLRMLGRLADAHDHLVKVLDSEAQLKQDKYLVPFACFELAKLEFERANHQLTADYVAKAKKYSGYGLDSRLHFRIHSFKERLMRSAQVAPDLDAPDKPVPPDQAVAIEQTTSF